MSDEQLEQEGKHFAEMLRNIQEKRLRLDLTDEEWMSIIARDRSGLQPCCANISALRDVLINIARDDGDIGLLYITQLCRAISWSFPSHDVPSPVMQKVLDQLEWTVFEYHEVDKYELR